jgi:hypothetical protein
MYVTLISTRKTIDFIGVDSYSIIIVFASRNLLILVPKPLLNFL